MNVDREAYCGWCVSQAAVTVQLPCQAFNSRTCVELLLLLLLIPGPSYFISSSLILSTSQFLWQIDCRQSICLEGGEVRLEWKSRTCASLLTMKLKVSLRHWHAEDLLRDRQSLIDHRRVSRDRLVAVVVERQSKRPIQNICKC